MKHSLLIGILFLSFIGLSQYTLIPDENFEQRLIDLGLDSGNPNGQVLTSSIDTLKILSVNRSGTGEITDLTGIEDFTSLESFFCVEQPFLTSINLSNNTSLRKVTCYQNPNLTSLDLPTTNSLKELRCFENNLNSLNVSNNPSLTFLYCYSNSIHSLDLSNNTILDTLGCSYNSLSSLNLSNNINLTILQASNNPLTSLDLSNNVKLRVLEISRANLSSIDLSSNTSLVRVSLVESESLTCVNLKNGNNTNLYEVYFHSVPLLNCIQVDDEFWFRTMTINDDEWIVDDYQVISEDCGSDCSFTTSVYEEEDIEVDIYPNPTLGLINFEGNLKGNSLNILNSLGQVIYSEVISDNQINIDLSKLSQKGIYYINVIDEKSNMIYSDKIIYN